MPGAMLRPNADGSGGLGCFGKARVGSHFTARAVGLLVDGWKLAERKLDVGDGVSDVFPLLPDLGKDFVKRRPISTPIAGHAGGFGKRRASTHLTNVEPGTWRATFSGHPMMSAEGFVAAPAELSAPLPSTRRRPYSPRSSRARPCGASESCPTSRRPATVAPLAARTDSAADTS